MQNKTPVKTEKQTNTPVNTDLAVIAAVSLLQKDKLSHQRIVLCPICRQVRPEL